MKLLYTFGAVLSIMVRFSITICIYYGIRAVKDCLKEPQAPYQAAPEVIRRWKRCRVIVEGALCGSYLLLFLSALWNSPAGIWTSVALIVLLYIVRIWNNMRIIK